MDSVVILAQLHPGRGRAIPLTNHVVVAGIGAVGVARPHEIQEHARYLPMHGRLAKIDFLAIGDLHAKPLEPTGRPHVAGSLHRQRRQHGDIAMQQCAAPHDVVVVAADFRGPHERRQLAEICIQLVGRSHGDAFGIIEPAASRTGEHSQPPKLCGRVADLRRRLLILGSDRKPGGPAIRREPDDLHQRVDVDPEILEIAVRPRRRFRERLVILAGRMPRRGLQPLLEPFEAPRSYLFDRRKPGARGGRAQLAGSRCRTRAYQRQDNQQQPAIHCKRSVRYGWCTATSRSSASRACTR